MKKFSVLLVFVVTLIATSCTETPVEPVHTDGDNSGVVIPPPPHP